MRRPERGVCHVFLGVLREHDGYFDDGRLEFGHRGVDRGLIVGRFALDDLEEQAIHALALGLHLVLLLNGDFLLRHDSGYAQCQHRGSQQDTLHRELLTFLDWA